MSGASQRKEGAAYLTATGFSQRRAARAMGLSRSYVRYSRRVKLDGLDERIVQLAHANPRYGHRRVWALLRRLQLRVNLKRVHRVFKAHGLQVRRRPKKHLRTGQHVPMKSGYPNQVWSYDFVHDSCLNGEVVKCLTLTDEFTKEALVIEVASSFKAEEVMQVLKRLFQTRGWPAFLRSDNGPEFIAHDLQVWLMATGAQTFYIPPGSPWANGVAESFNSKFRDECLNMEAFSSLAEAKVIVEAWRRRYNEERPHSSLGYLTPTEFRCTIELAQLGLPATGALPPDPRDLSLWAPPVEANALTEKARAFPLANTVRCISEALKSLPSVALPSPEMEAKLPSPGSSWPTGH
ncbi:IS3 family transposase [Geothrix sp. PMB-07]|uniref:IS3 family transposase n=1 Tax=Geothrix sp. PMB-07 TaxID=3068640 RepID=UPI00274161A2|nr:IS3 family transposase [Geothrix sp. PMB-07]WLT30078.1 IS3 family transposase [Geothrix sp. PMB-07]WLT31133.1 IS3 family transposase [Geothrix sp. PMB-07]WLT31323.1 IS3 family transposase [Geothrix sp. PMB-07]WLT31328.1 IS3 family transposase [Geothrix sp. PMB-07]WLT32323.1 IS3 family transposase [Geothrix sp. PMB-07]